MNFVYFQIEHDIGVCFNKKTNKWRAYIMYDYKHIGLGLFSVKDDAVKARELANIKYGFGDNHGL